MWLLLDWYDNKQWWLVKDDEVACTEEQMSKAVEGYFSIESARIVSDNKLTISGMVSDNSQNNIFYRVASTEYSQTSDTSKGKNEFISLRIGSLEVIGWSK